MANESGSETEVGEEDSEEEEEEEEDDEEEEEGDEKLSSQGLEELKEDVFGPVSTAVSSCYPRRQAAIIADVRRIAQDDTWVNYD